MSDLEITDSCNSLNYRISKRSFTCHENLNTKFTEEVPHRTRLWGIQLVQG